MCSHYLIKPPLYSILLASESPIGFIFLGSPSFVSLVKIYWKFSVELERHKSIRTGSVTGMGLRVWKTGQWDPGYLQFRPNGRSVECR